MTTLANSRSVWQKIVKDAMARGYLFDASDEKDLSNALVNAIIELDDSENLRRMDSLQISTPTFQVLQNVSFQNQVSLQLITRLFDLCDVFPRFVCRGPGGDTVHKRFMCCQTSSFFHLDSAEGRNWQVKCS